MANERDFDVLSDNLDLVQKRKKELGTISAGQYKEALAVYAESGSREGFSSPAEEAAGLFRRIHGELPLCSEEFARFCLEFWEQVGHRINENPFVSEEESDFLKKDGKTLYLKNVYGDQAFRCFSFINRRMRSVYAQGYSAACEEVYNGRGAYVILPIYNRKDGSLVTFWRLLCKYDLKITAACLIDTEDGDFVVYGLAQKGLSAEGGDWLELSIVLPDGTPLGNFLLCCQLMGLHLRVINSVPLEYASDSFSKYELHVCFHCREANLRAFALFLDASHIRYEIEGFYNIINR